MLHEEIIKIIHTNKDEINKLEFKEITVVIQTGWQVLKGRVCLEIPEQGRESPGQGQRRYKEKKHGLQKKSV